MSITEVSSHYNIANDGLGEQNAAIDEMIRPGSQQSITARRSLD